MHNQTGSLKMNKTSGAPDLGLLHSLLSECLAKPGIRVQSTWRVDDVRGGYVLDVIGNSRGGEPKWQLYLEQFGKKDLLFDYSTCDVLLVFNSISAACADSTVASIKRQVFMPDSPPPIAGFSSAPPLTLPGYRMDNSASPAVSPAVFPSQSAGAGQYAGPAQTAGLSTGAGTTAEAGTTAGAGSSSPAPSMAAPLNTPVPKNTPQPVNAAPALRPLDPILQGDIAEHPLDQLLKSIQTDRVTGKLEVNNGTFTAVLFIRDGVPVDATTSDAQGDDALVELLTWKTGKFVLEPRILRDSHTVHQPLDLLVAQSKQLAERTEHLNRLGMLPTSTLISLEVNLSDAEFEKRAAAGAPVALPELLKFYRSLDGRQSIEQLVRSGQVSRPLLISLVYHLINCQLIRFAKPIVLYHTAKVKPRAIDGSAIQSVMMSLRSMHTGMFIYPAFLYFLEQEYFRCYRSKTPLSVIVFEMGILTAEGREPLPVSSVVDATLRISQLKRHVDLLAHYDATDYALLLPNTKANGAQIFARRIVKALTDHPLAGQPEGTVLSCAFGCASMPEDSTDLAELLGSADAAMMHARESKKPVIAYKEIKPLVI